MIDCDQKSIFYFVKGLPGDPGFDGLRGKPGTTEKGQAGDDGETGSFGPIGPAGYPGPIGRIGQKGYRGEDIVRRTYYLSTGFNNPHLFSRLVSKEKRENPEDKV